MNRISIIVPATSAAQILESGPAPEVPTEAKLSQRSELRAIITGAMLFALLVITAFSAGCGSGSSSKSTVVSSTPGAPLKLALSATSGMAQTAAAAKPFSAPLTATVTTNGIPTAGQIVTFTAPASGASGTFANGTTTETDLTGTNGVATSSALTANSTAGAFTVTASVAGVSTPISFALTTIATNNYIFSMSGQESSFTYYALAGSISVDTSGNVLAGEQDYNDGSGGIVSIEPGGDKILSGTLSVSGTTGQGTLTLVTNNPLVGVLNSDGITSTETFAVQFVNTNHALIMQFDGSATSSGSMDSQTVPAAPSGNFAFAISGVDPYASPVGFGGVFSTNGNALSGVLDTSDAGTAIVTTNVSLAATLTAPDAYGRGTITGFSNSGTATPVALVYYVVGPEVLRLIDIDTNPNSNTDSALGSAFGQGTSTFDNSSIGTSIFALAGNPSSSTSNFAALGQFTTSNTSSSPANFAGVGDDNELDNGVFTPLAAHAKGTYSIANNGYGSLTFSATNINFYPGFGDLVTLGVYATDPTLNLQDPNNTAAGSSVGGALVVDLDDGSLGPALTGGMGVIVPQTDASSADFAGSYAFGWQAFDFDTEFDVLAQGSMVSGGALSLTGMVSDPLSVLGTPDLTSSNDTFTGTPKPDLTHLVGRYTMIGSRDYLSSTIDGSIPPLQFRKIIYQASATQLFWMDYYNFSLINTLSTSSIGPIEQQGSLAGLPSSKKPTVKPNIRRRRK